MALDDVTATAHPEDTCEECGGPNVVWFAPNDLWNRVMRGGDRGAPDVFGIVCPVCFIRRAEASGVEATGWLVQPEVIQRTPDPAITVDGVVMARLVDAVACAIYEASCFAYYGGDVGMTYWRDLTDEQKKNEREEARELIIAALRRPVVTSGDDSQETVA